MLENCPGLTGSLDWWLQGKTKERLPWADRTPPPPPFPLSPVLHATFLFMHSSVLLALLFFFKMNISIALQTNHSHLALRLPTLFLFNPVWLGQLFTVGLSLIALVPWHDMVCQSLYIFNSPSQYWEQQGTHRSSSYYCWQRDQLRGKMIQNKMFDKLGSFQRVSFCL